MMSAEATARSPRLEGQPTAELTKAIVSALDENRARWAEARATRRFVDPAFHFVRLLKGQSAFVGLAAQEAANLVELNVPTVWQDLPANTSLGDLADPVSCFLDAWETVMVPEGATSPLRNRIEAAAAMAREEPSEADRYGPALAHPRYERLRAFLRLVELLQVDFGSEPVPLPQGVIGDVMECGQPQVSRWVRNAKSAGRVMREKPADRRRNRCAEYRFVPYQIGESGSRVSQAVGKSGSPEVGESESQVVQQKQEAREYL